MNANGWSIHGPGLCWICNSCPPLALKPSPLTHTQTHKAFFVLLNTSHFFLFLLLTISSCQTLFQQAVLLSYTTLCGNKYFYLTSESGVRRRVGWWGVWSLCDGVAWDFTRVDHLSFTLRRPEGREETFKPRYTLPTLFYK